jgi:DHA1 family bicyclomycin/chloramphenicol resistance-like MFS transporter
LETPLPAIPINRAALVPLLTVMTALSPFTLNVIMPALPKMSERFGVDAGQAQLILSAFLIGMAFSQLMLGPLSDRFGRRPVLIGGLIVTVCGSLAAAYADSMNGLIAARIVQSLGASSGLVIGRAIVRDLYDQQAAARTISIITMGMVVAPMLAPTVGGLLDDHFGWRSIFAVVGACGLTLIVLVWRLLPETRKPGSAAQSSTRLLHDAGHLIGERRFLSYAGSAMFAAGAFYAFLGGAPHIVVSLMGRPPSEYGLWFALTSVSYLLGNACTTRYVRRFGGDRLIMTGAVVGSVGAALSLLIAGTGLMTGAVMFFIPMLAITFANGLQLPSAIAGTVSVNPRVAGSASGLAGFSQLIFGAIVSHLAGTGVGYFHSAVPVCALVLFASLASVACARMNTR